MKISNKAIDQENKLMSLTFTKSVTCILWDSKLGNKTTEQQNKTGHEYVVYRPDLPYIQM